MKLIKKIFIGAFYFFLVLILCISCKKNKPVEPSDYILIRTVGMYLKDSISNQDLIGRNGQRYNPDSIKVFTLKNNQVDNVGRVVLDSTNNYIAGIVYFYQLVSNPGDINIFTIDIPVYVYLNYKDTDTLQIKKPQFQDFNFSLNNNLILTTSALSNIIPSIIIKK